MYACAGSCVLMPVSSTDWWKWNACLWRRLISLYPLNTNHRFHWISKYLTLTIALFEGPGNAASHWPGVAFVLQGVSPLLLLNLWWEWMARAQWSWVVNASLFRWIQGWTLSNAGNVDSENYRHQIESNIQVHPINLLLQIENQLPHANGIMWLSHVAPLPAALVSR